MGREHIGARKYIYLCLTSLIFFSFFGCATLEGMKKRMVAREGLLRSQELLIKGEYKEALRENQEVLSMVAPNSPGDRALFNMGLIYAHNDNPEKDYKKAIGFFNKIIGDYPQSTLVEEAKIWVATLEIIEQEKQVDIEIEQKKKKLERQIVEREEVSPNGDPTQTDSKQGGTPAAADRVSQEDSAPSRKKDAHITVLEDEGGSLYFLALNHFKKANGTLFELILQANPSITDVRQINDHQEIIVPVITAESYIIKKIPDGDYRVYIGTFATYAIAAAYSQKVGNAEKLIFIDSREFSSQDTWYRLMMGDFKDKEEALKIVGLLEEKGLIYIPPKLDMMGEEKQVDIEKAKKNRELKKPEE
ncbi:MAG: SPOR domain-containing protein [Deltaproteobacteria bacterium]|nr:SPOR domain-containing protein [Deltaproteobacteria bacterium]